MKRLLFCATLALMVQIPDRAIAQRGGYVIAGLEAKLFYSNSGRFSANIIGNPKIVLHNAPIGEGTIEGPSENTLLLVRIQGPPKGFLEDLRLRITATAGPDTLADREIKVGSMNTAGNYYAPCWLEDTGCDEVTVVAKLIHGTESQRKTIIIPFECSE